MNLIWLNDRLIATTTGDLLVGLVLLLLAAAAGAHVWCGQLSQPILALYGLVLLFIVPIGVWLVLWYRHLVLDFRTNTYRFRDGLRGRGRSRAGDIAQIATLKVQIEERFARKGWKTTLFSIGYTSRDWRRVEAVTVSLPHLLPGGIELACCNERHATRLIERLASRFPFAVEREVHSVEL